jgi:predicted nucleic acid-binding protein
MSDKCFVDTNILIYAQDRASGKKFEIARNLINRLWDNEQGVLSTQVLQEVCFTVQRKVQRPVKFTEVWAVLEDYLDWEIVVNTPATILGALVLQDRYQVSFWDGLILSAAESVGAEVLCSEDLSHGQLYGTVRVLNPFATT